MSDWEDRVRDLAGSVRAEPGATAGLQERVTRVRRRRAAVVSVVSAAAVVGLVATVSLAGGGDPAPVLSNPETTESSSPTPTTSPTDAVPPLLSLDLWEEPAPGECPRYNKVFDPAAAPPIRDLAQQQATVAEITALVRNAFTVRYARPTPLGVVALVMGNVEIARQQLAEYGVTLVREWDGSGPEVGLDEDGQVSQVIGWQLQPVVHEVERLTRGIPGSGWLALWVNAGGVLVQWKEPVPPEVRALEDILFKTGARVYVEGVRYSSRELLDAGRLILDQMRRTDVDVSSASRCGDNSGLVVGVVPKSLAGRKAELERRFEEMTGLPVTVVPEGHAVDL